MAKGKREFTRKQRVEVCQILAGAALGAIGTPPSPTRSVPCILEVLDRGLALLAETHAAPGNGPGARTTAIIEAVGAGDQGATAEAIVAWELAAWPPAVPSRKEPALAGA